MIKYYTKPSGTLQEVEKLEDSNWINISPPFDHEAIEQLATRFTIPLDFLTDSLDIDERSRYEREEDIRLIVLNTPVLNEIDQENEAIFITAPIGIILVEDKIITVTSFESDVILKFIEGKVKNFNPANTRLFVLQLFEQVVFRFLECLKKLNLKRNLIEKELYNSARNYELKQLLRIEKSYVYFVNSLSANELLKMKMKRVNFLSVENNEYLQDLFEDIIIDNSQALEMANVYTNILNGTMEAYASIVSNNMNTFINRLTLITIVLMVPTLVASFYGMNVSLPLSESPYAFPIIVIVSIATSLFILWFFRRRDVF
jgi:magnesium transporter